MESLRALRRAREAITGRSLLLYSVGRIVKSGGQIALRITSQHAEAAQAQQLLTGLRLFLSGLNIASEQLDPAERWRRILQPFLPPAAALLGPSG